MTKLALHRRRSTTSQRIGIGIGIAAFVLAGCAGDDGESSPKTVPKIASEVPDEWPADAVERLEEIVSDLSERGDSFCSEFAVMTTEEYRFNLFTQQTARYIPRTLGSCSVPSTVGDESEVMEIVVHEDAAGVEEFIEERRSLLCDLAAGNDIDLPGLRFATGPDWSVQTDKQSTATDVAGQLGGAYRPAPCEDQVLDWEPSALTALESVAQAMSDGGIECPLEITDRDFVRGRPRYADLEVPAAMASCDAVFEAGTATVAMIAFADDDEQRDAVVDAEYAQVCGAGADVRLVIGDRWNAMVATVANAQALAAATGATVADRQCNDDAVGPAPTDPTAP